MCIRDRYYVKTYPSSSQYEHTSSYEPSSGLRIINLRFIDDNRNHVIDADVYKRQEHEFASVPGVKEDVTNIILNLKPVSYTHL